MTGCCGHCRDADAFFGEGTAKRDLRRYRKKGPLRSTKLLLEAVRQEGVEGATLLDVGGGVGAVQHELLESGLREAVHVDASAAYLEAARGEAERRGFQERVAYRHGDFVALAPELPEADIVTLDRVICCYPDHRAMLEAAAGRARRVLGLVYPRERRGTRLFMGLGNLWLRITGSAFRVYVHPAAEVDALLRGLGFRRGPSARTFLWRVETYVREG